MALIGVLTIASQLLAYRYNIPSILLLLLSGILVGPVLGWLDTDALLGDLLFPIVNLAVAIVLFEGALTLRFRDLQYTGTALWRMLSIGVLVTWSIVTLATHSLTGLDWPLAILFGAIMVVTGPTVIRPMLRAVRPTAKVAKLLNWEGIVIDPYGALLAVVVADAIFVVGQSSSYASALLLLLKMLAVGGLSGIAFGYATSFVLQRRWIPDYLQKVVTLLTVVTLFAISNKLSHESGLIAVTVMGIWMANADVWVEEILDFKESLSILLVSGLFILLAARLDLNALVSVGFPALVLVLVVQAVARPLAILLSTWPGDLTWRERGLLAWIAPRGVVAAAISALFALRLEEQGYPGANLLVPLAFSVIIGTVVWQSFTAPALARWLKVAQPKPKGILFVGASDLAVEIAKKLDEDNIPVMVVDSAWENIQTARMAGLSTYYGRPTSVHAERYLDLTGLGYLFAMEFREPDNALACVKFARELGSQNVFTLLPSLEIEQHAKQHVSLSYQGRQLFGEDASHVKLLALLREGAELSSTHLTEDFDWTSLQRRHSALYALLAWDEQQNLRINVTGEAFEPQPGEKVLSLIVDKESDDHRRSEGS